MKIADFFIALGLDVDSASVAEGVTAAKGLEIAFDAVVRAAEGVVHGIKEIILGTAEAGDHIKELSERTGINAQQLQRLAYGAQQSGVGMDELAFGLARLAKGGAKDVNKALLDLSDQIVKLPPGGARAKAAMDKLGRSGANLVPFLAKGREQIELLGKEAEEAGLIFSTDALRAADEFSDSLDALKGAARGVMFSIGNELIPEITPIILQIRKWIVEHRKLIAGRVADFLKKLIDVAKFLWRNVLSPLVDVLGILADRFENIAGIIGVFLVPLALKMAAAWALAAAPVVILGLVLAGLLLILEDIVGFFRGDESVFGAWIEENFGKSTADTMRNALNNPKQAFLDFIESIKETFRLFTEYVGTELGLAFQNAVITVKQIFIDLFGWLSAKLAEVPARAAQAIRGLAGLVPGLGGSAATASLMGGGASPVASQAAGAGTGAAVLAPTVNTPITINATGGQSPTDIANQVRTAMEAVLKSAFSDAAHAANGG